MSINLSNKEAMVLSKLAYANIDDEETFESNFKGKTLKEITTERCKERNHGNVRGIFV